MFKIFGDKAKEVALSQAKKYLENNRREISEKVADAIINYIKNISEEDLKKFHEQLVKGTENNREQIVEIIDKILEKAVQSLNT